MSGNEHEAGYFFKNISITGIFISLINLTGLKIYFHLQRTSIYTRQIKQIAQAKTAANLVEELFKDKSLNNTAIIPPKKELLTPLINSLSHTENSG